MLSPLNFRRQTTLVIFVYLVKFRYHVTIAVTIGIERRKGDTFYPDGHFSAHPNRSLVPEDDISFRQISIKRDRTDISSV